MVRFSHSMGEFADVRLSEFMIDHLELESTSILRDSEEGQAQLEKERMHMMRAREELERAGREKEEALKKVRQMEREKEKEKEEKKNRDRKDRKKTMEKEKEKKTEKEEGRRNERKNVGAQAGTGVTSRTGPLSHPGAPRGSGATATATMVSVIVRQEPPLPPVEAQAPGLPPTTAPPAPSSAPPSAPAHTPAPPPPTVEPAPTAAEPWAIIRREESPTNQEYWRQFRDGANSLHPSCGATTPHPA